MAVSNMDWRKADTDAGDNVINEAGLTFLADTEDEEFEPAEEQESLFGDDTA